MLPWHTALRIPRPLDRSTRKRLVDDVMERYVDWREQCGAVSDSYQRWSSAPREEGLRRFAAYTAALDREERAAIVYAGALVDLERLLGVEATTA